MTAASFSLLMLLATQGQQFTAGELAAILEGAGFVRVDTTATHPYYSVVTGNQTTKAAKIQLSGCYSFFEPRG